ncbi:MAG TPA: GAF domain-containing protein, partial [Longimicrobiaceae bacterium]|nr:GAF domain-containing protein [Longimicrobiaceae bacterium]
MEAAATAQPRADVGRNLHAAERCVRLAARVVDAPIALFVSTGGPHPGPVLSHGAPSGWAAGWERTLAARLRARLADAGASVVEEHAAELLPIPVACAAVPVCGPSGRVVGVLAALDPRTRGWPAAAAELLREVAALAGASLG